MFKAAARIGTCFTKFFGQTNIFAQSSKTSCHQNILTFYSPFGGKPLGLLNCHCSIFKAKKKLSVFEEPSHVKQLSLNHVCNIGLIPIAYKINYFARKADVWMTGLLLQCFCQYFFMKLGEAFVEPRPNPPHTTQH
jgi:hypothetical protein